MKPEDRLACLIDEFSSGRDRSMRLVGEIEGVLVADFLETSVYELLAEPVSLYRPGCGLPYYNEEEMTEVLLEARTQLTP